MNLFDKDLHCVPSPKILLPRTVAIDFCRVDELKIIPLKTCRSIHINLLCLQVIYLEVSAPYKLLYNEFIILSVNGKGKIMFLLIL